MNTYIGITIGPIFETMNMTSSPVALWASSYIFSLLSRTICECLLADGINEAEIVSPYYEKDEPLLNKNDGVGLFHDRIVFSADGYDISRINEIKSKAVKSIAKQFGISAEYLQKYVMVSAAEFETDNPIETSGKVLDSLELVVPFVAREDNNPILNLFTGDKYSKNSGLRKTGLVSSLSSFQLRKDGNESFKSLEEIVATGKGYKKYKYYAIIRSDGDNMSKIISELKDDGEMRDFSKTCLQYCSDIAEKVKSYGGVTIYSGGDDLLAILPCENKKAETVFDFIKTANSIFEKHFSKYDKPTSLSFGITIAYSKFPLYEALEDSASLLFDTAKKDEKNRTAIRIQKHSGQSEGLIIPNDRLIDIIELLNIIKEGKMSNEDKNRVFLSSLHKISMFEKTFNNADNSEQLKILFKNIFDASEHQDNEFLHEKLPEHFGKLKEDKAVKAINNDGIISDNPALTICYILRILKFFIEKEGGKNDNLSGNLQAN